MSKMENEVFVLKKIWRILSKHNGNDPSYSEWMMILLLLNHSLDDVINTMAKVSIRGGRFCDVYSSL